jgi:hypothetical protein
MNKGTRICIAGEILKKSAKNKIANLCFIIFGFPGETKASAQKTVNFLTRHSEYIDICESQPFVLAEFSKLTDAVSGGRATINPANKGMMNDESALFYKKFLKRVSTNSLRVNSRKLNYFFSQYHLNCAPVLSMMVSNFGLLTSATAREHLRKKRFKYIFPIIFGRTEKREHKVIFFPIDITETIFINKINPPRERTLDILEEKIFNLADGRLSVEDIIRILRADFKKRYKLKYLQERSLEFLLKVFSENTALGFQSPWR